MSFHLTSFFLRFRIKKWYSDEFYEPTGSPAYGNLPEVRYVAPQIHKAFKVFGLGLPH